MYNSRADRFNSCEFCFDNPSNPSIRTCLKGLVTSSKVAKYNPPVFFLSKRRIYLANNPMFPDFCNVAMSSKKFFVSKRLILNGLVLRMPNFSNKC